ncbi:MAG TPA: hypothetical protein ENJ01_07210 [Gammaproteobacteria bacterium]|nr:hypothetical protein [Gammaproteobacteria bacterium]
MPTEPRVPLSMLVLNLVPLAWVVTGGALVWFAEGGPARVLITLAWLYLFPPLLCRLWITIAGRPEGELGERQAGFLHWWALSQLQVIYARFPVLEELLRLVPGLYNLWLRLWGARVHLTVYWSPGVQVFDRYHLHIGRGVVIGGNARVGAHVIERREDGHFRLLLAPLHIEDGATLGMNAAAGPGVQIAANATVPVGRLLRPGQHWPPARRAPSASNAD